MLILSLDFQYEQLVALSVFRTSQRAGGVRNIFVSEGRKGPGVRERRLLEF